jgi:ABC-type dipeptide/oligopeptide/nickel transport system permease component
MLGGTVIVETVFAWPGIGKMCVDAALNRDFPLLQGAVLIMTTCFVLVNQIIDLLYPLLDPKLRRNG